jgi:hypothetical protein
MGDKNNWLLKPLPKALQTYSTVTLFARFRG